MKTTIATIIIMVLSITVINSQSVDNSPQESKTGILLYGGINEFGAGFYFFTSPGFAIRANIGGLYNNWTPSSDFTRTWDKSSTLTIEWMVTGLFEMHPAPNMLVGIGPGIGIETNDENTTYNEKATSGPYDYNGKAINYKFAFVIDLQFFFTNKFSIFGNTGLEASSSGTNETFTFPNGAISKAISDINLRIGAHSPTFGFIIYM
jgi:hypothetical protein